MVRAGPVRSLLGVRLMAGTADPGPLSAAIITHERTELFARAYRSLLIAVAAAGAEIPITVYNSSAASVGDAMPPPATGAPGREVHVPDWRDVAAKRALAVEQCRSPWLVTLDDDCEIAPDALVRVAERLFADRRESSTVGAYFGVTDFAGARDFWFETLESADIFTDFRWAANRDELPWGPTSLAVLNVAAVRKVGGFDRTIGLPIGGEDVDLCLRLRKHGFRLRAIPHVLAVHNTRTWLGMRRNLRRNLLYGAGELAVVERWPEYRTFDDVSLTAIAGVWMLAAVVAAAAGAGALELAAGVVLLPPILVATEAVVQGVELRQPARRALALALLHLTFKLGYQLNAVRRGRWTLLLRRMNIGRVIGEPPVRPARWKRVVRWSAAVLPWFPACF